MYNGFPSRDCIKFYLLPNFEPQNVCLTAWKQSVRIAWSCGKDLSAY